MKKSSFYTSKNFDDFEAAIISSLNEGVIYCQNDNDINAEHNANIHLSDVFLDRIACNLDDYKRFIFNDFNSNTKLQFLITQKEDVNARFFSGGPNINKSDMSFADFVFHHHESAGLLIQQMITTSSDSINHPVLTLMKKGLFIDANKAADLCTNIPNMKSLQSGLVVGMNACKQKDTAGYEQTIGHACVELIQKLNISIDYKHKGRKLYEIADKSGFGELSAYISSALLTERAQKIFSEQPKQSQDLSLPTIDRSL